MSFAAKEIAKKNTVKFKCDPCDYNIDYGIMNKSEGKGTVEKGYIEIECDPCDYNIDYGK